jgi:FixJ family two-component response regulator
LKAGILKNGAIDFVQKLYDPDEIIKHIPEVIDSSKS